MKKFLKHLLVSLSLAIPAMTLTVGAQVVSPLPYTLTNNTIADANQVMANFNQIVNDTNLNAATAGVNSNITQLIGLTTPLTPTQGGSSVYTFGTSTGSANAQVVGSPSPTGYAVAQGRRITFVAGFTNTGATTLNVNSTGALNAFKNTTSGVQALSGGELVAGAVADVWYDGTQYVLLSASPQALVPSCAVSDYGGHTVPSGWTLLNGASFNRTTQSALMACLNRTFAATTTSASTSVVVADSSLFQVGWYVGGSNVTCNTTITGIPDATHITIANAAGASGATTLTAGPYQQGDCSTTFNVGDFTGRITAGVSTGASGSITTVQCSVATSLGGFCGAQSNTLIANNIPVLSTTAANSGAVGPQNFALYSGVNNAAAGGGVVGAIDSGTNVVGIPSLTVNAGSTNTAISNVPPVGLVYKIIKL